MRTARANFAEADIRIVTVIDTLLEVWKLCRSTSPSSSMLLKQLPRAVNLLQSAMDVFAEFSPSDLQFPKFHNLKHLASAAVLFGPPWLQTTEFSEANHKPVKASVCHTSFNTGYQEYAGADYLRRQELLRIEDEIQAAEKRLSAASAHSDDDSPDTDAQALPSMSGLQTIPKVVAKAKGTLRELLTIQPGKPLAIILQELFGTDVSLMAVVGPHNIKEEMKKFLGLHGTIRDLVYQFVHDELDQKNPTLRISEDSEGLPFDTVLDSVSVHHSATVFVSTTKSDGCGPDTSQRRIIVASSSYRKRGD